MFWNTILLALREIRRNVMRSFLTILGIVIGVASVITMVTLGGGATVQVTNQIASLGSNLLMVTPGKRMGPGQSFRVRAVQAEGRRGHRPGDSDRSRRWPRSRRGPLMAIFGNENWSTTVTGTDNQFFEVRQLARAERAGSSATASCAPERRSASSGRPCARSSSARRTRWEAGFAWASSRSR